MSPLGLMILTHACVCSAPYPQRGALAVEDTISELVACGAIEISDKPNMIHGTQMGQAWLKLLCRTPAPTQAWIDEHRQVIP